MIWFWELSWLWKMLGVALLVSAVCVAAAALIGKAAKIRPGKKAVSYTHLQPHHLLHKKYEAGRVECSAGLADETAFLLCSVRSCFLMDLFSGRGRLLPGIQLRLIVFQPFQNRRPLTRHRPGSRFPAAG